MKILKTVEKFPGGLMVLPLLLGALLNTLTPGALEIGGFTQATFKDGALAILGVFLFCNGAQINVKEAGTSLKIGLTLTLVKLLIGAAIGLGISMLFGEAGFLTITPLAAIAALTNSNGGLYSALAKEYGDSKDVGAISILSINDGPFLTMVALGASGVMEIPMVAFLAALVPILLGFIVGNLDESVRELLAPGTVLLIPFFAFPLGANLNFMDLVQSGLPGILLGLICCVVTGFGGYFALKALRFTHPVVGLATGTTGGNAVATPAAILGTGAVATQAAGQITAAIIVTAILTPLLTGWMARREARRHPETLPEGEDQYALGSPADDAPPR